MKDVSGIFNVLAIWDKLEIELSVKTSIAYTK